MGERYSFGFVIRNMYWAFAVGQAFEALWLGQPVRAVVLLVVSLQFYGVAELVCWLVRHLRWEKQPA